jgi:hypothetical protein
VRRTSCAGGSAILVMMLTWSSMPPPRLRADAIAAAPSNFTTALQKGDAVLKSGPGGVAAEANVGTGAAKKSDPGANGKSFDDTQQIGPNNGKVPLLSTPQTSWIGDQVPKSYRTTKPFNNTVEGRAQRYTIVTSDDKVADAKAAPTKTATQQASAGPLTVGVTTTSANAIQTTFLNPDGSGGATGVARTTLTHTDAKKAEVAFSVAAINDPITVAPISSGSPGQVNLSIGSGFMLQATNPGDFASAYFEIGTSQLGTLAAFDIGVNASTTSLSDATYDILTLNPAMGFADNASFVNYLDGFLTFDDTTHTLSATGSIPLYTDVFTSPDTITFDTGAVVGSAPEPSSLMLLGLGGALAVAHSVRRRRRRVDGDGKPRRPPS